MWVFLALVTAFFTSFKDVIAKKISDEVDAYVIAWAWAFFPLPFLYTVLFFDGVPVVQPLFWKALGFSTAILTVAYVLYFKGVKCSDLSLAVPMLSFTPLFLLVTSPLILKEFPRPFGMLGVFFVVGGSYVLNFQPSQRGVLAPFKRLLENRGSRYILTVSVIYSIGANIDKMGVVSSSPVMWITAMNTTLSITLGILMIAKNKNVFTQIKQNWFFLVIIGLSGAIALVAQMYAIRVALVLYVIAIKRTSVVITALWGFFMFREKGVRERSVGIALMIAGVFVISFLG
ncbi:MAG: DMT family transporter [Candidatus Omnitrophica bacterium]|nr:DMT family transporter [Candidatus Omnitrophota bacterium]